MSGPNERNEPPVSDASGRGRSWIGLTLFAVGVALFVWLLGRLDLQGRDIRDAFTRVGWWFAAILFLTLVRFAVRTAAWMALSPVRVPFTSMLAATLSGDALGNVLPLGPIASEPAKAIYLKRRADSATLFAPLAAENFFYSVSVALYVIVAAAAMLWLFDLNAAIHLAGVVALGTMATVLAGALWLAWQQPVVASAILARLPFGAARSLAGRVRQLESQTYGAAGGGRRGVVIACEAAFHGLSLVECWLTFWLLTGVTSLAPALVYDGFNRVVNIVGKPIPGRIGVEEVGTAALASAIGYAPSSGALLAIVRKVRMVAFAALGLMLWIKRSR